MKKPSTLILKKTLFVSIICLLFLPIIQQQVKLIKLVPLSGYFTPIEQSSFSLETWFEGEYQTNKQDYLNDKIGFRPLFIRLYNQVYYTFFNLARANGVIIGKENYLYEENYIKAYLGSDFIGHHQIIEKVNKLQKISDTLLTKGIDIIVVLAPGKASFYPEFIPEKYNPKNRSTTNYEIYREKIGQSKILLLDFHQWFREMKATSPYPLFPKTGIHWSKYGEVLAADSIIQYINSYKKNKKIPIIITDHIETSTNMRDTDDDIERGMNILENITDLEMGYPQFNIQKGNHIDNPKVLTIADSYYWGMFNWGLSKNAFKDGQFWFYNQQIYPDSYQDPINVDDINIRKEVEKNDVILLISTDANLYKFAFGFIDVLYDSYFNSNKNSIKEKRKREERVLFYINSIKNTPEWMESLKKQAKEEKTLIEDVIKKNAEYMVWEEENKKT